MPFLKTSTYTLSQGVCTVAMPIGHSIVTGPPNRHRSIEKSPDLGGSLPNQNKQHAMPTFNIPDEGYIVLNSNLEDTVLASALTEAGRRSYDPVFKHIGGPEADRLDPNRVQSRVKRRSQVLRTIESKLNGLVQCFNARWSCSVFSYMRSAPGGVTQDPHKDYTEAAIERVTAAFPDTIPCSAILALMDGT